MILFNVLDELKQEREVLENFISQPDTKELIEKAIEIMSSSIKNGGKLIYVRCNAFC